MIIEIISACIATGSLVWAINSFFLRKKHERELKTLELTAKSEITFKEKQLAELYGPIYALLKQIRPIDKLWNEGKLTGEGLEVVEQEALNVIVSANTRIVELIISKCQLIDGNAIPESYTEFMTHVALWHAFLRGNPKEKKDVYWEKWKDLKDAHYKMGFEKEVCETAERLKSELNNMYCKYGLVSEREK